uniref:Uncharacterized protein n=1 Tax=Glossina pallidipes TaxID=7398 RepID=A0A1B0A010_GLOPL
MPIFSYYGNKNMCFVGGRMAKSAAAEEHFQADSNLNEEEQNDSKRKTDLTEARNWKNFHFLFFRHQKKDEQPKIALPNITYTTCNQADFECSQLDVKDEINSKGIFSQYPLHANSAVNLRK